MLPIVDSLRIFRFSPCSRFLLSTSSDQTLLLWDVVEGKCVRQFVGHERGVNDVSWGADGSFFASASDDTTVRIWDVEYGRHVAQCDAAFVARSFRNGRELLTLTGHESYVFSVEFSPHRNSLVSGSFDHSVRVWDCRCGQCARLARSCRHSSAHRSQARPQAARHSHRPQRSRHVSLVRLRRLSASLFGLRRPLPPVGRSQWAVS